MLYIVGKINLKWIPFKELPKNCSFVTPELDEVRIKYSDNGYYDKGWKGTNPDEKFAQVEIREVLVDPEVLEQPDAITNHN